MDSLETNNSFSEVQTAQYSKNPITCNKETTIQEAAQIMSSKKVGSILIVENKNPIGIITDKDLRLKIATGLVTIDKKQIKLIENQSTYIPIGSKHRLWEVKILVWNKKLTQRHSLTKNLIYILFALGLAALSSCKGTKETQADHNFPNRKTSEVLALMQENEINCQWLSIKYDVDIKTPKVIPIIKGWKVIAISTSNGRNSFKK